MTSSWFFLSTLLEVPLNGQPGSSCLLSRSFWYSRQSTEYSVYMLQPVTSVFVYFIQTGGYVLFFCNVWVFLWSVQVHLAVLLTYFIPAAAFLLVFLPLTVQFSLPCNKAGTAGILRSFIVVLFKVFCGPNVPLILPVIVKWLLNLLSTCTSFSQDIKFPKS